MRRIVLVVTLFAALHANAQWERVAAGVDYQHIERGALDVHVVRIEVGNPEVRIIGTRESDRGLTVSEFAQKTDALVAINADYFDEQIRPIGTSVGACGRWWRGVNVGRKQGLVAFGAGRAEIQARTQKTRRWMRAAVSGWPLLVSDCEVVQNMPGSDHFTRAPHPRTAVGLSADGRTAYFVVADGRRAASEDGQRPAVPGPTLPELATFMREELGVCRAMNLDGGGSSAMWIRNSIVNVPSDGVERKVGNHLAVVLASEDPGCDARERRAKE